MLSFDRRVRTVPARELRCYRCDEIVTPASLAIQSLAFDANGWDDRDTTDASATAELGDDEAADGTLLFRNDRNTVWHHPACALDVDLHGTVEALQKHKRNDDVLEAVYRLGLQRRRVANAIRSAREGQRTLRDELVERVEPARDRLGRPRVSVLIMGSGTTPTSWAWGAFEAITHDRSIASPLREYAFHTIGATADDVATDPSQPIVATVFLCIASVKVVKAQRDKLSMLRALDAPTPTLWIVGPETRDPSAIDAKVLAMRQDLERLGYRADEAKVFTSLAVDEASIRALVATLDDAPVERGASAAHRRPTLLNALDALDAAVRDGATEQYGSLVARLDQELRAQSSAKILANESGAMARLIDAAEACLREPGARWSALLVLSRARGVSKTRAVLECMRAMNDEPGRALSKDFERAFALLTEWKIDARFDAVLEALAHPNCKKLRRDALIALLNGCSRRAVADRLRSEAVTMKDKDARKAVFIGAASQIDLAADQETPP